MIGEGSYGQVASKLLLLNGKIYWRAAISETPVVEMRHVVIIIHRFYLNKQKVTVKRYLLGSRDEWGR